MDTTSPERIGVILNGVTGRMGTNQHLKRSILPIIESGGVETVGGGRLVPDPVLVGRNPDKLRRLAEETGVDDWTTDLDEALADESNEIYFDAQITELRHPSVSNALEHGKHVYCEKPSALSTERAVDLYRRAEEAGVVHGIVQDKLWLPGLQKLRRLIDEGFFGEILSVEGDFGYWVFTGESAPAQRPSWNYRAEDGGGIVFDMFCHWRYVLDHLFGGVEGLFARAQTEIPRRYDEHGEVYDATADDAAYAVFELDGGVTAQFNSSWTTRVRRDDLLTIQVDGTEGSAVAGLRTCYAQSLSATPKPVWNPDAPLEHSFMDDWLEVPAQQDYKNAFRTEWELFLQSVAAGESFAYDLLEGAKGVQLAEKGYESSENRAWVTLPPLDAEAPRADGQQAAAAGAAAPAS